MSFKSWSTGDKLKDDTFKGPNPYVNIEGFEVRDNVNKIDLSRPVRNVFENGVHNLSFIEALAGRFTYNGVFKKTFGDSTRYRGFSAGDSDIASITYNNGFGDTRRHFARLSPGVALHKGKLVVSRPQTHILERQLSKIFGLQDWNDEGVYINYFYNTDRYQAKIIRRNPVTGTLYTYAYGGTWGDSVNVNNFKNCFRMLENIWGDSLWKPLLIAQVGDSLVRLCCEPTIQIKHFTTVPSDTIIWRINRKGEITGDTGILLLGDSTTTTLRWVKSYVKVEVAGFTSKAGTMASGDSRRFFQNTNDFDRFIYLNVPRTFGDSSTTILTNPWGDTWQTTMLSKVINTDVYITTLRSSGGSAILGWKETTLPKVLGYTITPTRTQRFWMNKDLIVWRGGAVAGTGDTLGKSWASVMEMSGDSWTFHGDKFFKSASPGSVLNGLFPHAPADQPLGRVGNRWKIFADSVHSLRKIMAADSIISGKTFVSADTIYSGKSISALNKIVAGDSVVAGKGFYAVTGAIRALAGSIVAANEIVAGDSVIAARGILATTGAIRTMAGAISASTTISAGTDYLTASTTCNLINTVATTINFGAASTVALTMGAASGTITIGTGTSLVQHSGTGNFTTATTGTFSALAATVISFGTSAAGRTISIGTSTTATQTINIGSTGAAIGITSPTTTITASTSLTLVTPTITAATLATFTSSAALVFASAATQLSIGTATAAAATTTIGNTNATFVGTGTFSAVSFATLSLGTTSGTTVGIGLAAGGTTTIYSNIFSHTGTTSFSTAGAVFTHSGATSFNTAGNIFNHTGTTSFNTAGNIFSHTGLTSFATAASTFTHSGTGNFTSATTGTFSALAANLISFGTSAANRTINIGTGAAATQTINIGSANAAVGITSPTLTLVGTTIAATTLSSFTTSASLTFAAAATTLSIGAATGTCTINNQILAFGKVGSTSTCAGNFTAAGDFGVTGNFTAATLAATSARKIKTDIYEYTDNALDIINKTKIVKYKFIKDENKIEHIGFIADDTPTELSSVNKDTMMIGDGIGVLIKAIQEIYQQNEEMKKEIKLLNKDKK
jgi:hypothetical protein